MDVKAGKIVILNPYEGYVDVRVPFSPSDLERAALRQYDTAEVGFPDGRTLAPEQRRKAFALVGEIAEWAGYTTPQMHLIQKREFIEKHLEGLQKELFSLSNCDVTTAREYITYLIDFCLEFNVPTHTPLYDLCDDIQRYVYSCLMRKACAVCGHKADLHHVDRVGMGRNRDDICHIGMLALPLCREHHQEAHQHGDAALIERYHLEPMAIDERIAKVYRLKNKEE